MVEQNLISLLGIPHTPHCTGTGYVCACQYPQTNKFSLSLSQPFLHFSLPSFRSLFLQLVFYDLLFTSAGPAAAPALTFFLLRLLLQPLSLLSLTKCTWRDFCSCPYPVPFDVLLVPRRVVCLFCAYIVSISRKRQAQRRDKTWSHLGSCFALGHGLGGAVRGWASGLQGSRCFALRFYGVIRVYCFYCLIIIARHIKVPTALVSANKME